MIANIVAMLLELIGSCHCARWVETAGGMRCAVVVQRCELIDGWHLAGPFAPTCNRKCGGDS